MKQKVLLVDDRPENIFVLESTLDGPELEFIKADCGEEALRQLLRHQIALILMDVQMPGMDGFEAAELIRGNPLTRHIPNIFISAISKDQKHVFKGYASGAIDYMFKPFDPDILRSKVEILLDLDKQRRLIESQIRELAQTKHITDSILQNVNDGLFLLDSGYRISSHYSKALENIIGRDSLAGESLMDLLRDKISAEAYEASPAFLELSFSRDVPDEALTDLNPLDQIEYRINENGSSEQSLKYLTFNCRRIFRDEEISRRRDDSGKGQHNRWPWHRYGYYQAEN